MEGCIIAIYIHALTDLGHTYDENKKTLKPVLTS